jgi:predicted dehydrogenase
MNENLVVAQLGCGYWGPNLLRNFSALPGCTVKYVADASAERRTFVERNFPRTKAIASADAAFDDPAVDAIVIATPAATHFELARRALEAGKHILVEKPLATTVDEVDTLGRLAEARGLIVMAGHTFIYNAAVQYVKRLIDSGELGDVRYVYSQRLNLGRIRSDIDAMWNFAPHDISIIQYWLDDQDPIAVSRHGMACIQPDVEDVVFVNLVYANKVIANVHVSWLDPQKVRKITVVGSRKMVVYDDVADDKIAIFDKGIDRKHVLGEHMDFDRPMPPDFSYRSGDILLPQVKFVEPLRVEAEHFMECIRTGKEPATGITHARKVVSILERADAQHRAGGPRRG